MRLYLVEPLYFLSRLRILISWNFGTGINVTSRDVFMIYCILDSGQIEIVKTTIFIAKLSNFV